MRYKNFARNCGVLISELALGTGTLGNRAGAGAEKSEARKILQCYADAGGNLIDTSDAYQLGESEEIVGDFLGSRRHEYFLVSKYSRTPVAAPAAAAWGNNRKAMVTAVESSLKRLRTDYIDLYMPHFDDGFSSSEEIVAGLNHLVQSGKVLYLGFSNSPAWRVATATTLAVERRWAPIVGVELEYNLLQREAERDLLPMAAQMGLGVLVYSPLARGALSEGGKRAAPAGPAAEKLVPILDSIAKELGTVKSAVAIAWLKGKGLFPILGASKAEHLVPSLASAELDLTPGAMKILDEAAPFEAGYPQNLLRAQSEHRPKVAHP